ncbi:MAG: GNAT family N-acetyltransferase [Candidatus Bathyarchaeota archaeon]|nr:GNAT family N-acetyltransferase [Candidatus Bathyarchaeum sp.]
MKIRTISRSEVEQIKKINRSEIVDKIYYLDSGQLKLKNVFYNIKCWKANELEKNVEHLYKIYDRGGYIVGCFEGDKLVGVAGLDSELFGKNREYLQLYFLHVDSKYRKTGIGKKLLNKVSLFAKNLMAKKLYISATPSQNTVDFYLNLGCQLVLELNPTLYQLEPKDIHLELSLSD